MIKLRGATQAVSRSRDSALLAAAAAVALLSAGTGHAQTVPYQSTMRQQVGTGFGQEEMAKGGVFQPRVESAVQYVNNINLAEQGQEEVDTWGVELTPGFYASYSTDSVTAAIDYSIIGRAWGDSDYDDVSQRMAANGQWIAVQDLFSVAGQASISDAVINPQDGLNYGGLGIFGSGNLSQQATASVTPTLNKRFSEFEFLAQYSYGRVWYFDQGDQAQTVGFLGQDDSRDQSALVSFGTAGDERALSGEIFYDWARSTYQNALPYVFERLGLNGSWLVMNSLSLVGSFGYESQLDESTTQGGLDSNFWDAGVRWEPDDLTVLEARYGDRFFGNTYTLIASREARIFHFFANYSESPQVETRILSLGDFTPGDLPPGGDPGIDFGRLNSSPFVGKNAQIGVTATGTRTTLTLSAYQNVQDYVRSRQDDDTWTGVMLEATRDLASNLSVDFTGSYSDYEQSQLDTATDLTTTTSDYDTQFVLRLNRAAGEKLTTSLEAGYFNRSGSQQYDGWWAGLRANWTP